MRSIIILADALGFHYVRALQSAAKPLTIRPLESLIGYSPGIYASIWSSAKQDTHGVWTQWMLSRDYKPTTFNLGYARWVSEYFLRGITGKALQTELHPAVPSTIRTIFKWRDDVSSEKPMYGLKNNAKTIFEQLDDYKISYRFITHSITSRSSTSLEVRLNDMDDVDVVFVSIGDFDHLGHKFGPNSPLMKKYGASFLQMLQRITRASGRDCFAFSDHGMHPVRETVDAYSRLVKIGREYSLLLGKDYLYFLDGTLLRLWFFTERAKRLISAEVANWKEGDIIGESLRKKYGLSFDDEDRWRHGDLFFLAKPGVGIYPSFWLPFPRWVLKGLHGYAPESYYSFGAFISTVGTSEGMKPTVYDIAPTIADYLGIPPHPSWIGKSLL